jgi:anti-sigma factor RsiW
MIDCPNGEIRDQLPDYLHARLPEAIRVKVSAHVATCAACSAELALLRKLHGSMQRVPTVDVAKIVAALPPASRHRGAPATAASAASAGWSRFNWRVAASIAVLAVGGGAAAVLSGIHGPEITPGPNGGATVAAQQVATTAAGMESYLSEASAVELEALLDDLESFDGLPAGEPELAVPVPGDAEEGL